MEPAPASVFVAAVMKNLGKEKERAFARAIGLSDFEAPKRVGRWIKGENEPNYKAVMIMLNATGWLTEDARASIAEAQRAATEALEQARALADAEHHRGTEGPGSGKR